MLSIVYTCGITEHKSIIS